MSLKTGLILSLSISAGLLALFFYSLAAPQQAGVAPLTLQIASGQGFKEIAKELKARNLIRSEISFAIYGLITGRVRHLKPGIYDFDSPLSAPELISILSDGPKDILATIAPGMTVREIDARLSSLGLINKGDILNFDTNSLEIHYPWLTLRGASGSTLSKSNELTSLSKQSTITTKFKGSALEGFLLPDTYYFYPQKDAGSVIYKLLDNFEIKALPILRKGDNISELLILASLLEKEIPDYNEQKIAAGILGKRLAAHMPLQVDATVIYAKCQGQFLDCPPLADLDYKTDSAYNTYLYLGLPPDPISNPSVKTIEATVNPEKSDYWYYLSDPKTQKTIFSKTLDEHNQNRFRYLKK